MQAMVRTQPWQLLQLRPRSGVWLAVLVSSVEPRSMRGLWTLLQVIIIAPMLQTQVRHESSPCCCGQIPRMMTVYCVGLVSGQYTCSVACIALHGPR